jgi:hemolysin activation/secretion protein/AraC-like DNA-binding protein
LIVTNVHFWTIRTIAMTASHKPKSLFPNRYKIETFRSQSASILSSLMTVKHHLVLQELILRPSGEWTPQHRGWMVARVAEGIGYWMHGGNVRELNVGDGFIVGFNANALLRASQLHLLKLQFFTVQPQYLSGILTVAEWHQLEVAPNNPSSHVLIFSASEPVGQKFTRVAEQSNNNGLLTRCALLQLWVSAVAGLMTTPVSESAGSNKLHERFRQLVGGMTEAGLAESSLSSLARQLHCSERHFSRLFHEEFGVPLRARQIELRLQHACQLLAASDAKILDIAYDSGYRHLGLFNAMFKKRFGVTPSEWRRQNSPKNFFTQPRNCLLKATSGISVLLVMLGLFFPAPAFAQTNSTTGDTEMIVRARAALHQKMAELDAQEKNAKIHRIPVSTNAGPRFKVEKYLVMGNSILAPETIGEIFANVPDAFGTNVTFDGVRAVLGDLQMAYRERGFATVSVGLPQQKLTNATVKVQVTEGRLVVINVAGNRYFSSNNVLRALPSLHTNILLNSKVFQRELDTANASRDRQIYPVIGPGPEPGTSELTLKVNDRFPLHVRLEVNNQATPGTPALRNSFSAQYDNLWDLEHQVGVQYSYAFERFKTAETYNFSPFDDPLIANYSAYYRMPLGHATSVQQQIDNNDGHFGYNEITHQFQMPSPTGRPELTAYASRSTTDTGIQLGPPTIVLTTNLLSIGHQTAGENVTLNEGLGFKLSVPLPMLNKVVSTLTFGADYKYYRAGSANADIFYQLINTTNAGSAIKFGHVLYSLQQPVRETAVDYFPLNIGWSGSVPDSWGTTFFNAQANFNVATIGSMSKVAYTTNAPDNYFTFQLGADRVQTIYKDWSVKLHADGQWADGALFSNEQFAMGGTAGVRGYLDGEDYGDSGWRFSIEPQTPLINIGRVGNEGHEEPCWARASVFMDYGQLSRLANPSGHHETDLWGFGGSLTANIGNHFDGRLTIAFPLIGSPDFTSAWNVHIYFGVGAQF